MWLRPERSARGAPRPLRLDLYVSEVRELEHRVAAGSLIEPASSPNAMAVGAMCWQSNVIEPFSSQGPTIDNRLKPDITGFDSVSSATDGNFSRCGGSGFVGTSAATPHVAGAAALVKQANPTFGPAQLQAAMEAGAADVGIAGKDNEWGAGKLTLGGAPAPPSPPSALPPSPPPPPPAAFTTSASSASLVASPSLVASTALASAPGSSAATRTTGSSGDMRRPERRRADARSGEAGDLTSELLGRPHHQDDLEAGEDGARRRPAPEAGSPAREGREDSSLGRPRTGATLVEQPARRWTSVQGRTGDASSAPADDNAER